MNIYIFPEKELNINIYIVTNDKQKYEIIKKIVKFCFARNFWNRADRIYLKTACWSVNFYLFNPYYRILWHFSRTYRVLRNGVFKLQWKFYLKKTVISKILIFSYFLHFCFHHCRKVRKNKKKYWNPYDRCEIFRRIQIWARKIRKIQNFPGKLAFFKVILQSCSNISP